METVVYIKRGKQAPIPVRLKTVRQGGDWLAVAEIPTRTGPVRLTATASEQTVKDLIQRGIAKVPPEIATGASIWSSIAKLTQSRAAQNVLKQAQSVVQNPLLLSALSFVPGFGPAMQTVSKATAAVKAAENIMGRARQGDRKAQNSVALVANSAKKGSKKGTLLMALLQAADGVRRMFSSGDSPTREVQDVTAEVNAGNSWTPPWQPAASGSDGNAWTPPWQPAASGSDGNAWTPPWQAAGSAGASWTPPWGAAPSAPSAPSAPPGANTSANTSAAPPWPMPQPPWGGAQSQPSSSAPWGVPPRGAVVSQWPPQPPGPWAVPPPQLPPPTAPAPNASPGWPPGWPWFPRSTPKC